MNKGLSFTIAVCSFFAAIFSIVMMIMAIRFMEYGRVIFYLILIIAFVYFAIWGITNGLKKKPWPFTWQIAQFLLTYFQHIDGNK